MSGGASGGATSDECKIDIHSQAPLQPRGALIRVFIQSFICRAKQACKAVQTCACTHTHAHTHTHTALFILLMSIQSVMALFYVWVCHPFRAWTRVSRTICLAVTSRQMCGEIFFFCVRIGALLNCRTTVLSVIVFCMNFPVKRRLSYIKRRCKDVTGTIC